MLAPAAAPGRSPPSSLPLSSPPFAAGGAAPALAGQGCGQAGFSPPGSPVSDAPFIWKRRAGAGILQGGISKPWEWKRRDGWSVPPPLAQGEAPGRDLASRHSCGAFQLSCLRDPWHFPVLIPMGPSVLLLSVVSVLSHCSGQLVVLDINVRLGCDRSVLLCTHSV